jgi:hypothetical protein
MTTNTVEEPAASTYTSTLKMEVPGSSESVHTLLRYLDLHHVLVSGTFLKFLMD